MLKVAHNQEWITLYITEIINIIKNCRYTVGIWDVWL